MEKLRLPDWDSISDHSRLFAKLSVNSSARLDLTGIFEELRMFYAYEEDQVAAAPGLMEKGCRAFRRIEAFTGLPIFLISVGPDSLGDSNRECSVPVTVYSSNLEDLLTYTASLMGHAKVIEASVLAPSPQSSSPALQLVHLKEVWTLFGGSAGLRLKASSGEWLDYLVDPSLDLSEFRLAARF